MKIFLGPKSWPIFALRRAGPMWGPGCPARKENGIKGQCCANARVSKTGAEFLRPRLPAMIEAVNKAGAPPLSAWLNLENLLCQPSNAEAKKSEHREREPQRDKIHNQFYQKLFHRFFVLLFSFSFKSIPPANHPSGNVTGPALRIHSPSLKK